MSCCYFPVCVRTRCEFKTDFQAVREEKKKQDKQLHLDYSRTTARSGEHLCRTLGFHLDNPTSVPASPSPPLKDPGCSRSTEHEDPGGQTAAKLHRSVFTPLSIHTTQYSHHVLHSTLKPLVFIGLIKRRSRKGYSSGAVSYRSFSAL